MLYTAQISNIKNLPPKTQIIDITIQSSRPPWNIFAPTWDMVGDFKAGRISEKQYTEKYIQLIRSRYKRNKDIFHQLIDTALTQNVALVCYCPPETFCHRHLVTHSHHLR